MCTAAVHRVADHHPACHTTADRMEGLIEKLDARAIKIVLWPTKVAAERCDSFVHLGCRSSSLETHVSWHAARQVAVPRNAVREVFGRRVL